MSRSTAIAGLLGVAAFAAGCSESFSPTRSVLEAPLFAVTATPIALDQQNGTLSQSGTALAKGFNPTNPHRGDAIVATFFWVGSTNIITSVTDYLTTFPNTPVGNTYTLVDYVTAGGISMATYVATNVQNFPDPNATQDSVLAVRATLSSPVTAGGVMITAFSGVNAVSTFALGARHSASGSDTTTTIADAGTIPVGAGTLAYGVTMSNAIVGRDPPQGFVRINSMSDATMVTEGDYAVSASVGTVDPRWVWGFTAPSTWLATVLALNPPLHLAFAVQPSTTLPLITIQPAVQVAVLDAEGNRVTSFSGQVTIAIGHNGGTLMPGTLSGTKTVTAVNGVATFSDLSIDQPGNGYTLVASGAGLTGVESAPFTIGAF